MPKPSVALWRPKPITSSSASEISSCAADCPIASPSEKLCSPMPVAIRSASERAGDRPTVKGAVASNSAADAAPGPSIALPRCFPSQSA